MRKNFFLYLLIIALLSVYSCKEAETPSNIEYADIEIKDVEYFMSDASGNRIRFNASVMEVYSKKNKTILKDANFVQLNAETSKEMIKGKADYADIDLHSFVCYLSGNVEIDIIESGNKIYSSDIRWDKSNESITTEGEIVIDYGDIIINAISLNGDLKKGEFKVNKIIDGKIKNDSLQENKTEENNIEDLSENNVKTNNTIEKDSENEEADN